MITDKEGVEIPAQLAAKAVNAKLSIGVVVSFNARWLGPISKEHISLVLRKRVPQSASPKWMYIYVNSPASVLLGRAPIKKILRLSLAESLKRRDELALTDDEIRGYLHGWTPIGAYELGRIEIAPNPLRLNWLRQKMTFYPPQSFFFLSLAAQAVIDKYAGLLQPGRPPSKGN